MDLTAWCNPGDHGTSKMGSRTYQTATVPAYEGEVDVSHLDDPSISLLSLFFSRSRMRFRRFCKNGTEKKEMLFHIKAAVGVEGKKQGIPLFQCLHPSCLPSELPFLRAPSDTPITCNKLSN